MKTLKSNVERAKTARIFMTIMAIFSGLNILMESYRYYIFDNIYNGGITYEQATQFDQMYLGLSLFDLLIYILTIVFFIMWFRRAYFNLHQLTKGLRYSEGWAAGAWFIPIFSLFGPYQIATDLFGKTEKILIENGLTEPKASRHSIKGWWWGLWITGSIVGNFSSEGSYDLILLSISASIVSSVILLGAALLAIRVIAEYHEMEVQLKNLEDVSQSNPDNVDLLDAL